MASGNADIYEEDRPRVFFHPPTVLGVGIIAGFALRVGVGGFLPLPHPVAEGIGITLLIAALSVFVTAVSVFGEGGETLKPDTPAYQLLQTGPFARSRNPIYLAMMFFGGGLGFATLNIWIIITTALTGLILHFLVILPEERYLIDRFGTEYTDYQKKVRRWL